MKRVRVTELEEWQKCRGKHAFRYEHNMRRPPDDMNESAGRMASGSAVHHGIEVGLHGLGDPVEAAVDYLRDLVGPEKAHKFEKGLATAIAGFPEDAWTRPNPQTEIQYEVVYYNDGGVWTPTNDEKLIKKYEGFAYADPVMVAGKPDCWWYDDEGDIQLVDFKTSAKIDDDKLLLYEVFNRQLYRYAVLINDDFALQGVDCPPIYVTHYLLGTQGKHLFGQPKPVTKKRMNLIRQDMASLADEVGSLPLTYSESVMCGYCDYRTVCEVRLTGGDIRDMISEWGKRGEQLAARQKVVKA